MTRPDHRTGDTRSFGVKAGLVANVVYGANARILLVKLRIDGGVKAYRYFDVPPDVYSALLEAPSPASVFAEKVRKGGYQYERVVA